MTNVIERDIASYRGELRAACQSSNSLPAWYGRWDRSTGRDGLTIADNLLQRLLDQRRRGEMIGVRRKPRRSTRRFDSIRRWRSDAGGGP
jgi:hypothetical protein